MSFAMTVLICAIVLLICIVSSKISNRVGVPVLLLFIVLGMLFGSDGIFGIRFDNFPLAEQLCSIGLIFIMFYGGFGTNWSAAKPVAVKSFLLSSAGVVITAGLTGLFCWFVLGMGLLEGLLVGAVIGSTDAASVFSILRSKKLNLKHGLASLLELESGSNDPTAYTLTIVILSLMKGSASAGTTAYLVFAQLAYGLIFGFAIAFAAAFVLERISFELKGLHAIFVVAVALLAYAAPAIVGGNGYLSVYIAGIVLGNKKILHKVSLVHFFDGITWIMQILIFFSLGLLSFPSQMPRILPSAVAIALFLTFAARPAAVFSLMTPFRMPAKQQLLVAWSGLRGAASIVFAIMAMIDEAYISYDIFHIVFCVALLSVGMQGTLLPAVANRLSLVGRGDVLKTFNDYQDAAALKLIDIKIPKGHPWAGRAVKDIMLPNGSLAVMVKRGGRTILPRGETMIYPADVLVLSCPAYQDDSDVILTEVKVGRKNPWAGQKIAEAEFPPNTIIVSVRRGRTALVPKGGMRLKNGDVLVLGSIHRLDRQEQQEQAAE